MPVWYSASVPRKTQACFSQDFRREGIDQSGQLRLVLGLIDGGVGGAVDADLNHVGIKATCYGILVADVQSVNIGEKPMVFMAASGKSL